MPRRPTSDLPPEFVEMAAKDPEFLDQLLPSKELLERVAEQPDPESFKLYRNDEVAFDGLSDYGHLDYGLDIAFSEKAGLAFVAYTGLGLPSIIMQYLCASAEEAVALWDDEWALPLILSDEVANDNYAGSR